MFYIKGQEANSLVDLPEENHEYTAEERKEGGKNDKKRADNSNQKQML